MYHLQKTAFESLHQTNAMHRNTEQVLSLAYHSSKYTWNAEEA